MMRTAAEQAQYDAEEAASAAAIAQYDIDELAKNCADLTGIVKRNTERGLDLRRDIDIVMANQDYIFQRIAELEEKLTGLLNFVAAKQEEKEIKKSRFKHYE